MSGRKVIVIGAGVGGMAAALIAAAAPSFVSAAPAAPAYSVTDRIKAPVLAISGFGVALCAGVVALGLVFGLDWPLTPALAFGALIAATDPIAVIALLRETGVRGRLKLIIESEALINDGVAALLFALVVTALTSGAPPGPVDVLARFALIAAGGVAVGALVGFAAIFVAGRIDDHLVETALTAIAAYGSFLIAEHFGASGVLACVAAGLIMGNVGEIAHVRALVAA